MAHQIAVGMGVEIADGQPLHAREHFIADLFQDALRDRHHHPVIQEGGGDAHQIDQRHLQKRTRQPGEHRCRFEQQRRDIVVDQRLQEHRTCYARHRGEQDAHQHHAELDSIAVPDIMQQPRESLFRVFAASAAGHLAAVSRTAHRSSCSGSRHYSSSPFLVCWL